TKPAFRTSMAKRRCILPADGWFEWKRDGDRKQPFFMTPKDGSSLAMAGLWTVWRDKANPDAEPVISCPVLTTEAQGQLVDIHDRMPLLLPRGSFAAWLDLDAAADADTVAPLLGPPPADLIESLELRPVSTLVNSVRNNGPELVAREQPAQELDLFESQSP